MVIAEKIRNLLEVRHAPGTQFLVYVDGATDDTAEQLVPFKDCITVVKSPDRHGKSYGMNVLASLATGDILVFTDADTMLAPDVLERLTLHFAESEVGCVSGRLEYHNAHLSATSAANVGYWHLEQRIKQLETTFGSVIGATGSLFAARRELYPRVPDDIIDDFYVALWVLCRGYHVIQGDDVRAYGHPVIKIHEEFHRKVRIACQSFNVNRLLWPRISKLSILKKYCYFSHKFLRWFSGLNLGLAGILLAAELAARFGLAPVGIGVFALVAIGSAGYAARIRPICKAAAVSLALLATFLGVVRSLSGDRFQTWTSPASSRSTPGSAPQESFRQKAVEPATHAVGRPIESRLNETVRDSA